MKATTRKAFERFLVLDLDLKVPAKTRSGDYAEQDIDSWWYVWQRATKWAKRTSKNRGVDHGKK